MIQTTKKLAAAAAATLLACAWPLAALAQAIPTAPDFTAPPMAMQPSGGPIKGGRYVIDPTHTFVNYEIGHYGTTTNRGRFSTSDGSVQIDASGASGAVDVTMDMSSVNTGVDLLNRHVQSKDFFNVAAFPTARWPPIASASARRRRRGWSTPSSACSSRGSWFATTSPASA